MITRNLADFGTMENAHGVDARNIYDTDDAVITVITLKPGQSLKRHITPVDVAFYVLEGKGTVEIGGKTGSEQRHPHRKPEKHYALLVQHQRRRSPVYGGEGSQTEPEDHLPGLMTRR